jgi:hypothetical protein
MKLKNIRCKVKMKMNFINKRKKRIKQVQKRKIDKIRVNGRLTQKIKMRENNLIPPIDSMMISNIGKQKIFSDN